MASQQKDKFANKFYGVVVESAANTLTFKEIPTNVDVFSKTAWCLHRLEWYIPPATVALLIGAGDSISCALTSSDKLTTLGLDNAGVVDLFTKTITVLSVADHSFHVGPECRDFSTLPGGGLIIAPRPLYLACKSESLAAASTVHCRGFFTQIQLNADEYLELVDFYRIVQ